MAEKIIRIEVVEGMNNVDRQAPFRVILNMDTGTDNKLEVRDKSELWTALPGAHSLATDGVSLFLAGEGSTSLESLYKLTPEGALTEITAITGKGNPLYYVFFPDRVYISSRTWHGVYDYTTVRAWGTAYSDDPDLTYIYNSEEILPLNSGPPPFMEHLCLAGGRIWGSRGSTVYYNDPPLAYEMYRPDSFLPFNEPVTMIARIAGGMYFGSEHRTWFGSGYDPLEMEFSQVGDGVLPGSLQYIPNFRHATDVPVWTGRTGIFAGISGTVIPLTNEKVRFSGSGQAASLYREKDGALQYLSNFALPADVGFGDSVTCEVFRAGKLT